MAGAAAGAAPVKAVVTFPGIARAFAFDAGRLAWIENTWELRIRTLRTGTQHTIRYTNQYEEIPDFSGRRRLVMEQRRLLWLSTRGRGMSEDADHVYGATVDAVRGRRLTTEAHVEGWVGGYVVGVAGDASGFSYGVVTLKETKPGGDRYQVADGGVWSVADGTKRKVPGAPPAFVLARAAGRVAIVPANTSELPAGAPFDTGKVEIRNATTGTVISNFSSGRVRALALSKEVAVVLVGRRINRYEVASGRLLGSTAVPGETGTDLDIEADRIVFRTSRSIKLLDAATGRVTTVATTTPWRPSGVAIDGRTVAWTESMRIAPGDVSRKTFRTRIRTVTLR